MKIKMTFLTLVPIFAVLLTACSSASSAFNNTSWKLIELNGSKLPPQVQITLEIREGEAGGNAACNSYGSNFTQSGDKLTFTETFSTMMYCEDVMEYETEYLAALGSVRSFQIIDGLLSLQDELGKTLLVFTGY